MGLPGAGKSVQSELIRDRLGYHWLSTGQMLRNTADPEILAVQKSGALVNDQQMFRLVGNKLREIGYDKDFLLDGFPRTVEQAKWLVTHGKDINKQVQLVLYMVVDDEVAAQRLGGRGRADDGKETIKKRREEAKKIQPTINYLKSQGIPAVEIEANGDIESIFSRVKKAVESV